MNLFRSLVRSALLDTAALLRWAIEFLTPDDPTPLGVIAPKTAWQRVDNPWAAWGETPLAREGIPDVCEDCGGVCGVCQMLNARYYAPPTSGYSAGGAYHARADRD